MEAEGQNYARVKFATDEKRVIPACGLHYRLPFVRGGLGRRVIPRSALLYRLPFVRGGLGRRVIPRSITSSHLLAEVHIARHSARSRKV